MNKARKLAKGLQKKAVRFTVAVALLLAQIWTLAIPVSAASAIGLYPGGQNLLAASMANLVPGESETETITIKNIGNEAGTFYLRAERAEEGDYASQEAFAQGQRILDALEMSIYVYDVNNNKTLLYDGKANQDSPAAGSRLMDRRVLLGSLGSNEEVRIEVTVSVPAELDNSYIGQGKFWWHFTSEGAPPPVSSSSLPESSSRPAESSAVASSSQARESSSLPPGTGGGTTPPSSTLPPTSQVSSQVLEEAADDPPDEFATRRAAITIPLLQSPRSHDGWALLNLMLALLCLFASVIMVVRMLADAMKRRRDEEESAEDGEAQPVQMLYLENEATDGEDEDEPPPDEEAQRRSKIFRLLAIVLGVLAILVFFFTEDITTPMRLVDRWTTLMVVIALVDVLAWILGKKKGEDKDEDEEEDPFEEAPPTQDV